MTAPTPAALPPHDDEAEQALLGGLLVEGEHAADALGAVREILTPRDFFDPGHGLLFEVLCALDDRGLPPALPLVLRECEGRGTLAAIGGRDRIVGLIDAGHGVTIADTYAASIRDRAVAREVIRIARAAATAALKGGSGAEALAALEEGAHAIGQAAQPAGVCGAKELATDLRREWDTPPEGPAGIATGFSELDAVTGGLRAGQLVVLAGRTSMGKSTVALNLVRQVAVEQGRPVLVFSYEMSRMELARNIAAATGGVETSRLHDPRRLTREDLRVLEDARVRIEESPFRVCDEAGLTLSRLRSIARRDRRRHRTELIVVDYMQLMPTADLEGLSRGATREQQVSAISRGLKMLARELQIPVLALAQLNRGPETRDDHRPRLSDLRESGGIEADADLVLLLYRADYYARTEAERAATRGVLEVAVAKNRNGPTDTIRLAYQAQYAFIGNLARGGSSGGHDGA